MVGNLSIKKMDYLFGHVEDHNNRQYQSPATQTELMENKWGHSNPHDTDRIDGE